MEPLGHLINKTEPIGFKNYKLINTYSMHKEEAENYLHQKVENGEVISPVLPEGIKNYLIDIDGTVCDDIPNEEPERMATANHYPDALETLNGWYDQGHLICFFTSRVESHRQVTETWLKSKGFMNCVNVLGGIDAWAALIDREIRRY